VLDVGRGGAAVGVAVVLDVRQAGEWVRIGSGRTDDRGRLASLMESVPGASGRYRLTFDTGEYQRNLGGVAFFPEVQVVFDVTHSAEHVHVPLVLSPFGYSTYRGV
jgi:5-hydroxyisourate hydrolase